MSVTWFFFYVVVLFYCATNSMEFYILNSIVGKREKNRSWRFGDRACRILLGMSFGSCSITCALPLASL